MAEPETDIATLQLAKIVAETKAVAALAVQMSTKLEVSGLAQVVGLLSAASGIAVQWIRSVDNPEEKKRLADSLSSRVMGVADILQMVGDGKEIPGLTDDLQ